MRVSFPYPETKPLEIPEKNLLGIFSPAVLETGKSEAEILEEAFSRPIGSSSPLSEKVAGHRSVLILVDDYTRTTPVEKILPRLLKELKEGGIQDPAIKILIALGTHRPMNGEEITAKLGPEIPKQFPTLNHTWWDLSQLVHLGETESGTPILVNRLAKEADFILGIGQIVPHRVSGFSGGGNIVQPGICGEETTGKTHWLSAQFSGGEIFGKVENPVKEEIERVAQRAGLQWIVNTVQDGAGRLIEIVAGEPVQAYRRGALRSQSVYRCELPAEADIVVADSHPYDSDLWLAAKGIYASELAVKQGGVVILVTPCPEGVSPSHPEVLEIGYRPFAEVEKRVRTGGMKKLSVAAHLAHVGRVIKEKARGILVCPGISKEDTERMGFLHACEPQEALEMAFSVLSEDARVAVLQRGGEILPVVRAFHSGKG
jgi:nickel-dependent lactate racemase